jgi:hypothetical protein
MRNAAKGVSALLIQILLVTNAKYALRLITDKGNLNRSKKEVKIWAFFLYKSLTG